MQFAVSLAWIYWISYILFVVAQDENDGVCNEIQRVKWNKDPQDFKDIIQQQVPFVIEDIKFIDIHKWTPEKILNFFPSKEMTVKMSDSKHFRYFDESKHTSKEFFEPKTTEFQSTVSDFYRLADEMQDNDEEGRVYLYDGLSLDGQSPEFIKEIQSWNWNWILGHTKIHGWKDPKSHSLLIGMAGNITPLHFDQRHNFLTQVTGEKFVVLFPPADYVNLYTFPSNYACARQSMIDLDNPDYEEFPKLLNTQAIYTYLKAGESLFLPYGWFHYIKNMEHLSTSITFWYEDADVKLDSVRTLSDKLKFTMQNNIDDLVNSFYPNKTLREAMLDIEKQLQENKVDPKLQSILTPLKALSIEDPKQFLLDVIDGRFDKDYNKFV